MLKQRLITAAVLIPLFVWCIVRLATAELAFLFAAIVGLGAWEWSGMFGAVRIWLRVTYVLVVFLFLGLVWFGLIAKGSGVYWLSPFVVGWLATAVLLAGSSRRSVKHTSIPASGVLGALGLVVLIPAWSALVLLHGRENGPQLVLFLMILIWVADSGAYFTGRRWGKVKLAPAISPGKTVEGMLGALGLALLVAVPGGVYLGATGAALSLFVILCLVAVVFSIVGDLAESWIKRRAHVKDSGHLLPGHGGVLDRIDSLTAAAPLFVIGISILRVGP